MTATIASVPLAVSVYAALPKIFGDFSEGLKD
jgi:hypothetical protein